MKISALNKKPTNKEDNEEDDDVDYAKITSGIKCSLNFEKQRNLDLQATPDIRIILQDTSNNGICWLDVDEKIAELREEGYSYRDIEKMAGFSKSTIGNILKSSKS